MCGILVGFGSEITPGYIAKLNDALATMEHRGPDNLSSYSSNGVFLGHTRLSIIDIDSSSNQPFRFENLIMVFNGEVFNYLELREELKDKGYDFLTNSDTEVVLKAFHCYGDNCFSMFNGMWALAILDINEKKLTISRDRFGQKPLFVYRKGSLLVASSELQAITALIETTPNYAAIDSFLKEANFDVEGNTFFSDVFEFPPATTISCNDSHNFEEIVYWTYPSKVLIPEITYSEFHDLLENSVSIRLRTDVKYSLLLSGGCDSTIIAGLTRKLIGLSSSLTAYTYASGDKFDETKYAQIVANSLDIDLHFCGQDSSPEAYIRRLRHIVRNLGRGHGSPAIVSVDYLYEKLSGDGFKVTLDGQGADELLAGYSHYHFHLIIDLLKQVKLFQVYKVIGDLINKGFFKTLLYTLRLTIPKGFRKVMRILYGYEKIFSRNSMFSLQKNFISSKPNISTKQTALNKYLIKQHTKGLKNLLYYGDILAMLNSVENRSPFLDHRLVEKVFSAGFKLKVYNGKEKAVLREHEIYKKFSNVLDREKIGFSSNIPPHIKAVLVNELKQSPILLWPIFNQSKLFKFLESPASLSLKFEPLVFRLFQVHLWHQEFFVKK
jgi:asparagine synthase (glutamine-hydrolysing)